MDSSRILAEWALSGAQQTFNWLVAENRNPILSGGRLILVRFDERQQAFNNGRKLRAILDEFRG